jgi:hypothetical protein
MIVGRGVDAFAGLVGVIVGRGVDAFAGLVVGSN